MRILLIAIGTRGDVQPFVALGKALLASGHEVSIASAERFAAMVSEAGLDHYVLPMDFHDFMQVPEIRRALTSLGGKLEALRWAATVMTDQLNSTWSAMWSLSLELQPDLILHHFTATLAPSLARKLGAISIPVFLQPGFVPTHDYPQFLISTGSLGRFGNIASHRLILTLLGFATKIAVRRWQSTCGIDLGAAPLDPTKGYRPRGDVQRIHAYSEVLVTRPTEWPESEVQTGYLFSEPQPFQPDDKLAAFLNEGPAPIYLGFGSMPELDHGPDADIFRNALQRLGLRAVIATGWGALSDLKSDESVYALDAVPHTWLFPKVAAVVHHGGSGTTHEGLRWGRPSAICPVFVDQPFFGRRVASLGAGPEPVPLNRLTEDLLVNALETVLSDPVRHRAAKLGEQISAEDGIGEVCALVDRLA